MGCFVCASNDHDATIVSLSNQFWNWLSQANSSLCQCITALRHQLSTVGILYGEVPVAYSVFTLHTNSVSWPHEKKFDFLWYVSTHRTTVRYKAVPYGAHTVWSWYLKLVLRQHDLPDYANSTKQSQLKCCEDAETSFMYLLWWCPFKIQNKTLPTMHLINIHRLNLVLTLVNSR